MIDCGWDRKLNDPLCLLFLLLLLLVVAGNNRHDDPGMPDLKKTLFFFKLSGTRRTEQGPEIAASGFSVLFSALQSSFLRTLTGFFFYFADLATLLRPTCEGGVARSTSSTQITASLAHSPSQKTLGFSKFAAGEARKVSSRKRRRR